MRLAVLTGGGDVPGLNPCIRSIAMSAYQRGWDVIGLMRGWEGVLEVDPSDPWSLENAAMVLDKDRVRGIDRQGGTILHSSRCDPRTTSEGDQTQKVLDTLDALKVDALITMGGDGTLRFSAHLASLGRNVISIPKTMDNDVFGTDYCIGFSTAITRSVEAINSLRTTAASHERIAVIELFGRRSGETALLSGFLSQADRTVIAEVPADIDVLLPLLLKDKQDNPESYALCIVSEGAKLSGTAGFEDEINKSNTNREGLNIGTQLAREIEARSPEKTIVQELAYLMRAGEPDAMDRMVGFAFGALAVQLIEEGRSSNMVCLTDGNYGVVPIDTLLQDTKGVNVSGLYDANQYRANLLQVEGMPMFLY
ncbi:6-phosphofructokinase [Parasphingorhabdus halotolerans]|uniref:6-phosphofructokinase n=1 Tax=Parasphingorhabdus halotolerans TaxID=2725558 RepID=A0A6H2DH25_9SPHN|nr:6-phosphofructokinase [Parasphingorhabdus halotolerans]QJB67972.1 6-phosphofructokinase [Parasphingorhabdus halotolerans]